MIIERGKTSVIDEKRQQKAMLLLEHQEAEEELAQLRARAARISGRIAEVQTWLNRVAFPEHTLDPKEQARDATIRTKSDMYREALNFDAALSVVNEIAAAKKRLADLASMKESLGLR